MVDFREKLVALNLRALLDYVVIIFGAFIMAGGIGIFLIDASGLSMAIHYLSGNRVPVGLMIWIFNIPLYIWGVKELGKQFGARTFVGFTFNSFFIDFLRGAIPGFRFLQLQKHPAVLNLHQTDFLFTVFIGAVLLGLGLGVIFKFRGSTAGSDILAAVAQKRWGTKPGMAIMIVDFLVISFAGFVIHFKQLSADRPALTLTLYAFFLLFVSSRLIDVILEGFDYAKSALIITAKIHAVSDIIRDDLNRGATVLQGHGLYTREQKEIIYTVLSRKEIVFLTQKIKELDPTAFIIVNNVHEVLGEGFRPRI